MNQFNANINETFIIEPLFLTGESATWTACTGVYTSLLENCSGTTRITLGGSEININQSIVPEVNSSNDLGSTFKRFRTINSVSGNTSYWNASVIVSTPSLDLGVDSDGNTRVITANNSVIQDDTLNGGGY